MGREMAKKKEKKSHIQNRKLGENGSKLFIKRVLSELDLAHVD
jgi:hypothetical protein